MRRSPAGSNGAGCSSFVTATATRWTRCDWTRQEPGRRRVSMKVSPRADYPVRVLAQEWDEQPHRAELYRDVFAVTLNHVVEIVFVPDVGEVAPPWDGRTLPPDLDDVSTPAQAR